MGTDGVFHQQHAVMDIDDQDVRHVAYTGYGTCEDWLCGVYYQSSADGINWSNAVLIPGSEDVGFLVSAQVAGAPGGRAYIGWFGSGGIRTSG
ncbi:MAG: hypothetical protein AB1486_10610 [Planctomycetota bacterium]